MIRAMLLALVLAAPVPAPTPGEQLAAAAREGEAIQRTFYDELKAARDDERVSA